MPPWRATKVSQRPPAAAFQGLVGRQQRCHCTRLSDGRMAQLAMEEEQLKQLAQLKQNVTTQVCCLTLMPVTPISRPRTL